MGRVLFKDKSIDLSANRGFLNKPIGLFDWICFFIIAVFCYISFLHGDILCTAGSSISYLGGHIKDFYEYNPANGVEIMNNYLPSTYILFAIWNIPIYLLNLVSCPMYFVENVSLFVKLWYKALPVIFFFASGFVILKIGQILGFTYKKSKLLMYIFFTTPIAFFSPLIFGQYDSFTLFFTLLGVYYYFKDDAFKFVFFFAIAMTFKYFAFLIFLPLLLLREKKILKIFVFSFLFFVPCVLESLFYIGSKNFKIGVLAFKAPNYLLKGELNLFFIHPSLFLIAWVFLLVFCYMKRFDDDSKEEFFKWAIYLCNVVVFFIFGLSMWHPQWLIFMVPFTVLGSIVNKKAYVFFVLDSVMFFIFVVLCSSLWRGSVDERLMEKGIFNNFIDFNYDVTTSFSDFIPKFGNNFSNWLFSCFSALMLFGAVFKHPKYMNSFKEKLTGCNLVLRFRLISIFLFWIVPCLFCVFSSSLKGSSFFVKNTEYLVIDGCIGPLTKNREVEQIFTVPENISSLNELRVSFNTSDKVVDSKLIIYLKDVEKDKILFSREYETYRFKNIIATKFNLGIIPVESGKKYSFVFKTLKEDMENMLTINKTKPFIDERYKHLNKLDIVYGGDCALIEKETKKYNLSLDILGR